MTNVWRVSLLLAVAVMIPPVATGAVPLELRVSPPVSLEPAYVTVRVTVEADADNRTLEVVAETADFFRSSQIPMNGDRAPRVSVIEFRALPTGIYEVSGRLIGLNGTRARTSRTLVVAPSAGGARGR